MLQNDDLPDIQNSTKLVSWLFLWQWWRTSVPDTATQDDVRKKVPGQATLSVSFVIMNSENLSRVHARLGCYPSGTTLAARA